MDVKSLIKGQIALEDEIPWINYAALEYIFKLKLDGARIFEWGAGGSTIWFAKVASKVISIDHDQDWADTVLIRAKTNNLVNIDLKVLKPETLEVPYLYRSTLIPGSFRNYVRSIDSNVLNDLIFVDGRARIGCISHAVPKLASDGILAIDNSERYPTIVAWLETFMNSVHFVGPGPYVNATWRTSFFWHKQ